MSTAIERRIGWSARAFRDLVWPVFVGEFSGQLIPNESVTDSYFAKMLDMRAGIDAWLLRPNSGPVMPIASRVQPATQPWNTFTVRMSRPGAKRPQEFERWQIADSAIGAIKSHYIVQGYVTECPEHRAKYPTSRNCTADCVDRQSLISAAIVCRTDLMAAVEQRIGYERTNSEDGVIFWCTQWRTTAQEEDDWHKGNIRIHEQRSSSLLLEAPAA